MAYSTSNPPRLVNQNVGGARRTWEYESADPFATVRVAGYITNAGDLGMKVGDLVRIYDSNLKLESHSIVITVASTGAGAADLSDPTADAVATNTD